MTVSDPHCERELEKLRPHSHGTDLTWPEKRE